MEQWLDDHPLVSRVAWCDAGLGEPLDDTPGSPIRHVLARELLHKRGVDSFLIAPDLDRGLTRTDLDRLASWLSAPGPPLEARG